MKAAGEWRVVVSGNSSDGFSFDVKDVSRVRGQFQITKHTGIDGEDGRLVAHSRQELREILKEMLGALDKPVLQVRSQMTAAPALLQREFRQGLR